MYLSDDSLESNTTPVHRKMIGPAVGGGERVYFEHQPRPFAALAGKDLLDTADLCRILRCSTRTIYRWINEREHPLTPKFRAGRELLFTKTDLLRWYAANRPRPGRPPIEWR